MLFAFSSTLCTACSIYYQTEAVRFDAGVSDTLPSRELRLAEGARLTMLVCGPCHYNPSEKKFSGNRMVDVPKIVGKVYASSLVNEEGNEIMEYTLDEFAYLLRTGVARSGRLMPYMQRPNLADKDILSIFRYLRSSDTKVSGDHQRPPATTYSLLGKIGMKRFFPPLRWSDQTRVVKPDVVQESLSYGRYLIDNLACYECHSGNVRKIDKLTPEKSYRYMAGGNRFRDYGGNRTIAKNLTFDSTGLATWTWADFDVALREGFAKNGSVLRYPMPRYHELTAAETRAMYDYLQTIPSIRKIAK